MALRDLVVGGGACVVPGSDGVSSSANPLGGLADSCSVVSPKLRFCLKCVLQERVRELPGLVGPAALSEGSISATTPGVELDYGFNQANSAQVDAGLFRRFDSVGFSNAWSEATGESAIHGPELAEAFPNYEPIYPGVETKGPPQTVLAGVLASFLHSRTADAPFCALPLPELGLSEADKRRIRDRSSIMARHFFADRGEEFVSARVNTLLQSLEIDSSRRFRESMGGRHPEFEGYWNEVAGLSNGKAPLSDVWAEDFQRYKNFEPGRWAEEFQAQRNPDSWADQFGEFQEQLAARDQYKDGDMNARNAVLDPTRSLVNTLTQNQNPKFQNSKFLQFVSKMSRGELIMEDNQVKPRVSDDWAREYNDVHLPPGEQWAGEQWGDSWADEFIRRNDGVTSTSDDWVKDFSRLHVQDWADEYAEQIAKNPYGDGSHESWIDSYDKFVGEQIDLQSKQDSSKLTYIFSEQNPYVGHPSPVKEGQELFRRGLLSEAVLALEAELLRNPSNSEAWRLLGITHAENDDDKQVVFSFTQDGDAIFLDFALELGSELLAIASMVRARDADPRNLEVLLALGVGHTNGLERVEALGYLAGWLQSHPRYSHLVPEDVSTLSLPQIIQKVNEAALVSPDDGDVHTVLGVLYNLSREFDKAITSFERALQLKPRDYSLWNKLGATRANSAQSADAIYAYQQALDLKPNYVRAWSNMGIGYSNQGLYEDSIRYYVRALGMNPKADSIWDCLKLSLSNSNATWEMVEACERRDLEPLQKAYSL